MAKDCSSCAKLAERLARVQETLTQHQKAVELCAEALQPRSYVNGLDAPAAILASATTTALTRPSHHSAASTPGSPRHRCGSDPNISAPPVLWSTWQSHADGLDKELTSISTRPSRGQGRSRQIAGDFLPPRKCQFNVGGPKSSQLEEPSMASVPADSKHFSIASAPFSIDYSAAVRSTLAKIGPRRASQMWTNEHVRQETATERMERTGDLPVFQSARGVAPSQCYPGCKAADALKVVNFLVVVADMTLVAMQAGRASVSEREVYATAGFTIWYIVELLMRVASQGWHFFTTSGFEGVLNKLDCVVAVSAVFDSIRLSLTMDSTLFGTLVKVFRLLRVVRLLCCIRDMKKLFYSMLSSAMTLIWSLVSLFLLIFVFAMFFTQSAVQYLDKEGLNFEQSELRERLHEDFGSVYRSMLSLFKAITSGRSWGELSDALAETHPIAEATFIVYMCLALIGILNVVTAVFVESAMRASKNYKELMLQEKQIMDRMNVRHMKKIFKSIDSNSSGSISMDELEKFIADENLGLQMYFQALDISARDTQSLFLLLDSDESGEVDIDEFCDGCMRLGGHATSFDLNSLLYEQRRTNKYMVQSSRVTFQQLEWLRCRLDIVERSRVGTNQASELDYASFPRLVSSGMPEPHRVYARDREGSESAGAPEPKPAAVSTSSFASVPSSGVACREDAQLHQASPTDVESVVSNVTAPSMRQSTEFPDAPSSLQFNIGALLEGAFPHYQGHEDQVSKVLAARTRHDFKPGSTIEEGDTEDSPTPTRPAVRL